MLIRMFVLKIKKIEKKINPSWNDHIAEQIVLVITLVSKQSMNSSEITTVQYLIYLFF